MAAHPTRGWWRACTLIALLSTSVAAQNQNVHRGPQDLTPAPGSQLGGRAQLPALKVSFAARNEPLESVVKSLAQQVGLHIGFVVRSRALANRISVNLKNVELAAAFDQVLSGTELEAILAPDRQTIIIREKVTNSPRDTASQALGEIHGRVTDSASGEGIAGVTVVIQKTGKSTVTNRRGDFVLTGVPAGDHQLSFRMLGYVTVTRPVQVSTQTPVRMRVPLRQNTTVLSEIVTTATGRQRRVEVGHDIATINADSLMRVAPIQNVSDMLAVARIPGVTVEPSSGLPGAPSRIRIRGIGSIMGNNDPAIFVDGVRISGATSGSRLQSDVWGKPIILTSRLDDIDPDIIETIEVLRGPSAGALYGTDAANGVIVITTKKGKSGPARWTVRATHDWNTLPGKALPVVAGWGRTMTSEKAVSCQVAAVIAGTCVQDSVSVYGGRVALISNEAPGSTTSYNTSVEGGTKQLGFRLTVGYDDITGPIKIPEYQRIRIRRAGMTVPDWLDRPSGLTRANVTSNVMMLPADGINLVLSLQLMRMNNESNSIDAPGGTVTGASGAIETGDTLVGVGSYGTGQGAEGVTRVIGGLSSSWSRSTHFQINATIGMDYSTQAMRNERSSYKCGTGVCQIPIRGREHMRSEESVINANLSGSLTDLAGAFRKYVSLIPSFGINFTGQSWNRIRSRVDSIITNGIYSAGSEGSGRVFMDSAGQATAGIYADVRIGVLQRVYTSVGIRRDIGSTFGRRGGLQNYPKFNTSWLVSDEGFFPKNLPLDELRLRFGFGLSGNQPVQGSVAGGYVVDQAVVGGVLTSSLLPTTIANPRLRPERGMEYELGFDLLALDQRIDWRVTLAEKLTNDALTEQLTTPGLFHEGPNFRYENIARVVNRSVEMSLNAVLIDGTSTLWSISTGASTQSNQVKRLGSRYFAGIGGAQSSVRIVEGYPIGGRWEQPVIGYHDRNGDGLLAANEVVLADSAVYIGWSKPRYSLSYSSTLGLLNRRLVLTANLAQDVGVTQSVAGINWGVVDVNSSFADQAFAMGKAAGSGGNGLSQTLTTLRLNAASISLEVSPRFARMIRAQSMSVSVTGRNLGLWSRYIGRDPAVNSNMGEARVDSGNLIPPPKQFSLNVRMGY